MSTANQQPLLEVKNLRFSFGEGDDQLLAIDDVSFSLTAGESLGIVGESGSGKSLTALSLIRLCPDAGRFDSGRIIWEGSDLLSLAERDVRQIRGKRISMIFQEPLSSLNPVLRCGEQVVEALRLHLGLTKEKAAERAKHWFERVQLRDPDRIFRSYPHELSGGQRQRVMIAMALCTSPDLLIADEPTTALDVTVQRSILDLLNDLRKELGTTLIFISHDLAVIRQIADRVLVMQSGKIIEEGMVDAVFSKPKHPYTTGLLLCRPPLDNRLRRLPTVGDSLERDEDLDLVTFINQFAESAGEYEERSSLLEQRPVLLKAEGLSVWFSNEKNWLGRARSYVKAVDDVSFSLRQGERLGIVGESGSGKTTLGRAILRLSEARAGQIIFEGENILELSEQEFRGFRPQMQMVFQDPFSSLNPRMTIGNALMEPLSIFEPEQSTIERKEKVVAYLEKVGMQADHFDRYPHEFSGGQRQRIGLARAILLQPKLLICDESVSALDVSVQAQVLNLIRDLQEEYLFSVIFISHDLSVIKFIADRVLVMKEGKVVERGGVEELFANPKETYTKELLAAIPR